MKIFVTGGTGFVGGHAVCALAKRGYQVRLLVRSPDRVGRTLEPLGVDMRMVEWTEGNILDPASVERAAAGCDAALHAAALYTTDQRRGRELHEINVVGTERVLDVAVARDLDPIVHVSSYVVLLPPGGAVVGPDDPLGRPKGRYSRSKAGAEEIARRYQSSGAPVVTIYPGEVLGPDDPYLGQTSRQVVDASRSPTTIGGGMPVIDVRDVARVLTSVMERGRGPRRYLVTGHYVAVTDFWRIVRELTGRQGGIRRIPAGPIRMLGRLADLAQRIVPGRIGLSYEDVWAAGLAARYDDSRTTEELGITPRGLQPTIRDTIAWMLRMGHLPPEAAGHLGS